MIKTLTKSVFGTTDERTIKKMSKDVKKINSLEWEIEKLEDSLEDARVKLSRDIPKIEKNIEDKFAQLEALQIKLDVMNKEFEIRMNEV